MLQRDVRLGLSLVPLLALIACGGTPTATGVPSAPTNVVATPEPEAIDVTWSHDGVNVSGFVVDREVASGASNEVGVTAVVERLAIVGGIDADSRSFRDATVEQGVAYRYSVAAVGTGGAVSASTSQAGTAVQAQPAVVMTCDDPTDEPIVDAVLAAGIRGVLGIASGPTCGDLLDLDWLHLSWPAGDPITSLEGLEHALYLRDLGLDGHSITSLAPVAQLGGLRNLNVGGNPIADASPLAGLTRLQGLAIWGTDITTLEPLSGLVNLHRLYFGGLDLTDIAPIAGMTELRNLHAQVAIITDLDFVANHPELVELDVSNSQVGDDSIPVLGTLTHLEHLGIGNTAITDVSFLDDYTNLHSLWVWSLDLDDVTPITSLTGLRTLDVGDLGISDLSFLAPFDDLVSISVWGNGVTDISVLQDKPLEWANVGGNLLTDLGPLVENTFLGAGAWVDVRYNCLDLTPGSAAMIDVQALLDRGVGVDYEPQNDVCL